jgi:hypothetical protein
LGLAGRLLITHGKPIGLPYAIDVIPRPVRDDPDREDNPAHAQVEADRDMNDGTFKRLRRALAMMSSAELDPNEPVVYFTRTKKVFHKPTCHHVRGKNTSSGFRKALATASPCTRCRPHQ